MLLLVFVLPFVSSAPPLQFISSDNSFTIRTELIDYQKIDTPRQFIAHVFNSSNGVSIKGASCIFHLYNSSGNHIYKGYSSTIVDDYDYEFKVSSKNFSNLGYYNYILQCNSSVSGGFISETFEVTNTGKPEPSGIVTVFFIGSFLLILLFMTYLLLSSIGHFMEKNFDILDLAWDYGIYFVLIGLYIFEGEYIANPLIHSILDVLIVVGGITHIFAATIFFLISLMWASMEKQRSKEGVK
jgi:hypothetical protein